MKCEWEAETFFFSLFLIFSRLLSSLFFFLIQGDAHMLQCYELFMRALKKTWTRTPYANFIENICVCVCIYVYVEILLIGWTLPHGSQKSLQKAEVHSKVCDG